MQTHIHMHTCTHPNLAIWKLCRMREHDKCFCFRKREHRLSSYAVLHSGASSAENNWQSRWSCWPSHLSTCFGAGDFGLCNFGSKYFLKRVGDAFWRTAFYDIPIRQAVAQQLRKTAWTRQADIVSQPDRRFAEISWKGPMRNESWISCFALDPM